MNKFLISAICLGALAVFAIIWMTRDRIPVKAATNTAKAVATGNLQTLHTVSKGETLYGIARQHRVSVADIKNANQEKNELIRVGRILVIPKK